MFVLHDACRSDQRKLTLGRLCVSCEKGHNGCFYDIVLLAGEKAQALRGPTSDEYPASGVDKQTMSAAEGP